MVRKMERVNENLTAEGPCTEVFPLQKLVMKDQPKEKPHLV